MTYSKYTVDLSYYDNGARIIDNLEIFVSQRGWYQASFLSRKLQVFSNIVYVILPVTRSADIEDVIIFRGTLRNMITL